MAGISLTYIKINGIELNLESVNFNLLLADKTHFDYKVHNVVTLVSLELNHFTVFRVKHNCTIAGKLLDKEKSVCLPA